MFVLIIPSTKPPNINHRTISSITLASSLITHQHQHQEVVVVKEEEEEESINNRSYWSRKIHRLCAVDHNVDKALWLVDRLRLRGYRPDSLNLSSIIHALCDSNRFSEAHHRLLISLSSGFVPIDHRTCNLLIARFLNSSSTIPIATTLHLIHSLISANPHFVPSLINYNRLIHRLCSFCPQPRPTQAHRLFFDMKSRGHSPNVVSYTTLINGYCLIGEVGVAHKLFDEMSDCGVHPNSLTYSVLIRGVLLLPKNQLRDVRELMGKLWQTMAAKEEEEDTSATANNAAFANLIDSLCHQGFFHEVFKIAEDIPQGESVPEEFAFGQMIDSLCKAGRHNGAARIVYIMRKRGLTPSLVSYNAIVHWLSLEDGSSMRAYQLLEEGIEFGYSPSEYTYKVLVESLCRESDLCKARKVLQVMLNKEGMDRDSTRIYNIYLRALCLMNDPSELLNVLLYMLQTQCQPDVITLNTVINGFCKAGRTEEGYKILRDMMMGKFCAPDAVTFTTIITGFLHVGRVEEALDLLYKIMPENGISPGVVTYNAVLHGLFKLRRASEAMEVYKSMVHGNVIANSTTYAIIVDGLCQSSDRIDEAKKFWDDVIWPSKVHDSFVYAAILKALCRCGKLNEACDFLYELVDCGVTPNIVNYNILIDSACKLGLTREAYKIVEEMRKNGLTPDAVTWRILDKLHGNVRGSKSVPGVSSSQSRHSLLELSG